MLYLVLFAAGFAVGLIVGRWWALVAAVGGGIWIGRVEEVEVPGWVLAIGYGVIVDAGIAAGVLVHRRLRRRPGHGTP
jgi:hypothetical protein